MNVSSGGMIDYRQIVCKGRPIPGSLAVYIAKTAEERMAAYFKYQHLKVAVQPIWECWEDIKCTVPYLFLTDNHALVVAICGHYRDIGYFLVGVHRNVSPSQLGEMVPVVNRFKQQANAAFYVLDFAA